MEKFRIVEGHSSYSVSNKGRVYSYKSDRFLKASLNSDGYYQLRLDGKAYKVHKLVAAAFLNHESSGQNRGLVVDHIDGDKSNNNLENLREVSPRGNRVNYIKRVKSTSKYVGVCWDKSRNKWFASIKINGKQKNLGRFTEEYDAYLAYQNKLKELNGN